MSQSRNVTFHPIPKYFNVPIRDKGEFLMIVLSRVMIEKVMKVTEISYSAPDRESRHIALMLICDYSTPRIDMLFDFGIQIMRLSIFDIVQNYKLRGATVDTKDPFKDWVDTHDTSDYSTLSSNLCLINFNRSR